MTRLEIILLVISVLALLTSIFAVVSTPLNIFKDDSNTDSNTVLVNGVVEINDPLRVNNGINFGNDDDVIMNIAQSENNRGGGVLNIEANEIIIKDVLLGNVKLSGLKSEKYNITFPVEAPNDNQYIQYSSTGDSKFVDVETPDGTLQYTKLSNLQGAGILGNSTSGSVKEVKIGNNLSIDVGNVLNATQGNLNGDISSVGIETTIGDSKVTYSKMQNISAPAKLLGSSLTGSGAPPSELSIGTGLKMTGSTVNMDLIHNLVGLDSPSNQWILLGRFIAQQNGTQCTITINIGNGYTAVIDQPTSIIMNFCTSDGTSVGGNGFAGSSTFRQMNGQLTVNFGQLVIVSNIAGVNATEFDFYFNAPAKIGAGYYKVDYDSGSWENILSGSQTDPGTASDTVLFSTPYFALFQNRLKVDNTGVTLGGTTTTLSSDISGSGTQNITNIDNISPLRLQNVIMPASLGLIHVVSQNWSNVSGSATYDIGYPGAPYIFLNARVSYFTNSLVQALEKTTDDGIFDNRWCIASSTTIRYYGNLGAGSQVAMVTYWVRLAP